MTTSARIGAHRTWPFAALAIATVFAVAACGNASPSTSASQPASATPSAAAPSVASVAPSVPASVAPTAPASVQPSSGTGSASDPAKDVKIAAPYTIAPLPAALQSVFEQQMQASLGALGNNITFGFRTIAGGAGQNILMVMAFPSGTLSASAFTGMVGGMGASMNANLTKTTTDGVDIFAGASPTGGVAIFHVGDHAIIVISEKSDDALKVAQALVGANQ